MNSEIEVLLKKIDSTTEPGIELVDALNELAQLQMAHDISAAAATAQRAIEEAQSVKYKLGEALALVKAGLCAARQRNYDVAAQFYEQALSHYESLGDERGIAEVHAKFGNVHLEADRYDEAIKHYNAAIALRIKLKDELGVADLYTNSAIIHGFRGNYSLALKMHMQAINTYEHLNESARIASSANNIGLIYWDLENYDEALVMFERALSYRQETNNIQAIGDLLNNIGNVYHDQKNFSRALEVHHEALQLREQTGEKVKIASSYINLGHAYKETGDYQQALSFYNRSLSLFQQVNDRRKLLQLYSHLGELYFELGKYEDAYHYLNEAMSLAEETGLKNQLLKVFEYQARLFAQEKKYEEAYHFQMRFAQLAKEISNTETSRQMARMTVRYEIEQKERETELERVRNTELQKAYNSLEAEKKRSEELLNNILPEEVSEELKQSGKTRARSYEQVSVMFADIQGFTKISEQLSAEEIVSGIDEYFEAFDKIIERHRIEKIKTIGDAYLCAGGIPVALEDHAAKVVLAAVEFLKAASTLKVSREKAGRPAFNFRIGIHTGPVVAGVVGIKKFAYDIWGDTVNTASRMQQNSEPNRINISQSTYQLVKDKFNCSYRGEIEAKNKGKLKMYFVGI